MFERLLLNILVVLIPIFSNYILLLDRFYEKDTKKPRLFLGLFCGIAIVLCMQFPIVSGDNGEKFIWDLRWVAFLVALLYGGYTAGSVAYVFMIVYRLYLGGGLAFFTVFIDALLFFIVVPLLHKKYITLPRSKKIWAALVIALITYLFVMGTIAYYFHWIGKFDYILSKSVWLFLFMAGSYIVSMMLCVILAEIIIENITLKQQSHLLVVNSIDPIAIVRNKRWVYMNPSGLRLFEAKNKEMIGKTVIQFLHPKHQQDFTDVYLSILKGNVHGPVAREWISVQGTPLFTEMVSIPYLHEKKFGIQVILRDISERKKAEEMLIQSEKLSVAGELAAGIAHEIRNPITAIKGFIYLIKTGVGKKEHFDIISDEMNRIELILSELLVLAKPQSIHYERKQLANIIHNVVALLNTQAIMKNIEITTDIPSQVLWIYCDENQIKQVFINLIKNAIDAMSGGGMISMDVSMVHDRIQIKIADQGHGITAEQLARIGTPFYSLKENGTGLGLAVSYRIIESHQGHVSVESTINEGTVFTITFPLSAAPA